MNIQLTASQRSRFQTLLMKAVDGEISKTEQAEFDKFIQNHTECQTEWDEIKKLKEVTKTMNFKSLPQETWDSYWVSIYNRLERKIAWILFSIGSIILLTYGGFKAIESIVEDQQLEGIIKGGLLLLIGGLVMLLVSVIREKLFVYKSDPYKEVKR